MWKTSCRKIALFIYESRLFIKIWQLIHIFSPPTYFSSLYSKKLHFSVFCPFFCQVKEILSFFRFGFLELFFVLLGS